MLLEKLQVACFLLIDLTCKSFHVPIVIHIIQFKLFHWQLITNVILAGDISVV